MIAAPSVRFRQLVENALAHLTWFDTVCGQLGMTGISQVWDEEPAWYFWLGGRSFLLRYAGGEGDAAELTAVLHAFPTREEFSDNLTLGGCHPLLTKEHFDFSTMTPQYESFALFQETFVTGEMTLFLNDGELRLLAASGNAAEWNLVWAFTEFLVAMLTFHRKVGPVENPYRFFPEDEIATVLVPFDSVGSSMAREIVAADAYSRVPAPPAWHRLAHEQVRCSAKGACACSLDH